jgi:ribosomal protein S17E
MPYKDKDKALQCKKKWAKANSKLIYQRYKHKAKLWHKTNKKRSYELARKYRLKADYGITPEQYNTMLACQNNLCAICGKDQSQYNQRFAVDHDHNTGKIRKLLCHRCNTGIGMLDENVSILQSAINYLNSNK